MRIRDLVVDDVEAIVELSLAAWAPVFAGFEAALGADIYGMLFPDWQSAQAAAVEGVCRAADNDVWVAVLDRRPVGFVAVAYVDEDAARAGEIVMLAVDPGHQRAGIGDALFQRALTEIAARGIKLAVVATGGDPGHAPARALYQARGFTPLPLVRYYRKL